MLFTKKVTLCVLLCSTLTTVLYGQTAFRLTTSQLDHTFEVLERMTFNIEAIESGQATFSIHHNAITIPLEEGRLSLRAGRTYKIDFTLDYPGTVWFELEMNGEIAITAATFSPFQIEPQEVEPEDFDVFWEEQKTQLAEIPVDAKAQIYQENEYSTCYQVNLAMINNRRVYGYVCVPKGEGNYPAVLSLPSFGASPNLVKPLFEIAERVGAISMSISIHDAPPEELVENPYQPDDPANPAKNYFRYAILASIRAIDYLESCPDFSGKLAVTGVSQGGGLAIMTAGLDERVDLLVFSNPTHTEHQGLRYGIASGFPYYLEQVSNSSPGDIDLFQETAEAIKYYDAVYFAKRFRGTTLGIVGYNDQVCPAATTFAAFNQLGGKKILFHGTSLGHQHPNEYWKGQQDAFRRFLQPSSLPPFPYASKEKGYFIDIEDLEEVVINEIVELKGIAFLNEKTLENHIFWQKKEGRGRVNFGQPKELETTITFSDTGTYVLQLSVEDRSSLMRAGGFYTLMDEIEIKVVAETKEEKLAISCPEDLFLSTTAASMVVEWELPKILENTCNDTDIHITQVRGMISGSTFPVGISTIEYEITNKCGLLKTCSFDLIIEQTTPDTFGITCSEDIYATVPILGETVIIEWEAPEVNVPCEDGYTLQRLQGVPSGSRFTLGKTTITYLLTDECGNRATCSFDVVVGFGNGKESNRPSNNATVFPNPVGETFSLNWKGEQQSTFIVQDVLGRVVLWQVLLPDLGVYSFFVEEWGSGVYFWEVLRDGILTEKGKVIKH